jgi:hypothetical protein
LRVVCGWLCWCVRGLRASGTMCRLLLSGFLTKTHALTLAPLTVATNHLTQMPL